MRNKDYMKLCVSMTSVLPGLDPRSDFSRLCMSAGVASDEADNRLYAEFGMSGEEILEQLYSHVSINLL